MYHQIQRLHDNGHSRGKIGSYLVYRSSNGEEVPTNDEEKFEQTFNQASTRSKILSPYETFVKDHCYGFYFKHKPGRCQCSDLYNGICRIG